MTIMFPALLYGKDIRIAQAYGRSSPVYYFAGCGSDELNVPVAELGNERHIGAGKQGIIC